ncbi:MAG: hypothetical protein GY750_11405 [Lentisphaerae bacterium]|nr:hypothetical protein [Lentisphaerota bacterium]MCP4102020.1 hypothetical protein [Lentisphaerota bacterium]
MLILAIEYSELVKTVKRSTSFLGANQKKYALRALQRRVEILDKLVLSVAQIEEYTRQLIIITT